MGDLSRAQREVKYAEMSADSSRWDEVAGRLAAAEQALEGVADADQAPVVAAIAALRQKTEAAERAEKARALISAIERQIRGGDPEYNGPEQVESYARRAEEMLASENASCIPPERLADLRQRIATMRRAAGERVKQRALDEITPRVTELEERLRSNPFTGRDDADARAQWQELHALLVAARNHCQVLPEGDADRQALGERIDAMELALTNAANACERDGAVASLRQSWQETQERFAGWEAEDRMPTWAEFIGSSRVGLSELRPRTIQALREAWSWQHDSLLLRDLKEKFAGDTEVRTLLAAVDQTITDAGARLWQAFDAFMTEAERAPMPTDRRDLELPTRVLHSVDGWFGAGAHLEPARARAQALHDAWQRAVDELDRQGQELYRQLQAKADAAWPAILSSVPIEPGFTPAEAARFRGKTILLEKVRNRSGWDFDGQYGVAVWVGDVPVAGDYEPRIAAALHDTARRTRTHIDTHRDWDLLCVVEGTGRIQERVEREVRVGDSSDKVKFEEKVARACVTVRVVGLRAGAVAMGPTAGAEAGAVGA